MYCNARSLVNKTTFLESQLALKGYDIVAVTESHLDTTILNAELFPPIYVTTLSIGRTEIGKVGVCFWL